MVSLQFHLDPYNDRHVFIFCNKKRNAIKILRYDEKGFVVETKKLVEDMMFQWPRTADEEKREHVPAGGMAPTIGNRTKIRG